MIYVFLADGFEECEALAPVDILRRANFEVLTVGVSQKTVCGSHGIPVVCDITDNEAVFDGLEAIVLPGGMPGTLNLENSPVVQSFIDHAAKENLLIGAICAAPSILGHKGLLTGKKATCFSGFEEDLEGAVISSEKAVLDGNFVTAFGAGAALDFGFLLLQALTDAETAEKAKKQMRYIV